MKRAWVLIAHGSKHVEAQNEFLNVSKAFAAGLTQKEPVYSCFLEFQEPSLEETLEKAIQGGMKEIFLVPLMVFSGRHVKEDIPSLVQKIALRYPDCVFHTASPLGQHPRFCEFLKALF